MRIYSKINQIETGKVSAEKQVFVSRRKLNIFASLFCVLISFATLGITISNFGFAEEIRTITASWSPSLEDIGKLKFVSKEKIATESEVASYMSELTMPFNNTFVTEKEAGSFLVNGLGQLVVKSCLDGVVTKVENKESKKILTISHGKGITSIYEDLDVSGVKEGDRVKKNSPIGISYNSVIVLKLKLGGKVIAGLTVKDGEMTFS